MMPSYIAIFVYGAIETSISFLIIYFLMPRYIRYLIKKGNVVLDYHKAKRPTVPRPAGPIQFTGIANSEIIL
jgi:UDP-N-acetylmuramyl pentapeptide phosphotransferase/UDP-N-acetylglucosamine-1-phosphate transferase